MNEKMNRELDGIPAEKLDSLLSGVSEVKASDDLSADRVADRVLPALALNAAPAEKPRALKGKRLAALLAACLGVVILVPALIGFGAFGKKTPAGPAVDPGSKAEATEPSAPVTEKPAESTQTDPEPDDQIPEVDYVSWNGLYVRKSLAAALDEAKDDDVFPVTITAGKTVNTSDRNITAKLAELADLSNAIAADTPEDGEMMYLFEKYFPDEAERCNFFLPDGKIDETALHEAYLAAEKEYDRVKALWNDLLSTARPGNEDSFLYQGKPLSAYRDQSEEAKSFRSMMDAVRSLGEDFSLEKLAALVSEWGERILKFFVDGERADEIIEDYEKSCDEWEKKYEEAKKAYEDQLREWTGGEIRIDGMTEEELKALLDQARQEWDKFSALWDCVDNDALAEYRKLFLEIVGDEDRFNEYPEEHPTLKEAVDAAREELEQAKEAIDRAREWYEAHPMEEFLKESGIEPDPETGLITVTKEQLRDLFDRLKESGALEKYRDFFVCDPASGTSDGIVLPEPETPEP